MTTFTPIDLSQLPAPSVVEPLDFESLLQARKERLVSLWPAAEQATLRARLALESEPLTKLLEENTYRELLLRQRVNEAAQGTMLAKARGSDLEQIAAGVNLTRLVVTPANPSAVPPTAAVLETDDALRERVQMAWEGLSVAGPRNAYILHARNASGQVADASATSPSPAVVTVTVQSLDGDGSASAELLSTVSQALNDEDVRPVGDRLIVQSAQILTYQVKAVLHLANTGAEGEVILATARQQLAAYVNQRRRLGVRVSRSGIDAALHVAGVAWVELQDWQDLTPTEAQAAYCTATSVTLGA
ncbi:baseplate J/gp47 family protein [Pseudomonas oryzihabitans]|uniref:baseplate J/gp47 family protein n=1 Tax=Pseudomonas oryzihabitans TaxID=47885 RepID=UPI0028942F3B|nr:baseplate J/gp47 family protein [Pseudomonas oryzihabitans]MDT3721414.1 baseplate J/gp47 family protein [Pseudomonas oryzihabitans]